MKNVILVLTLLFGANTSLFSLESQIILINSEAYLVDLDDNYDVVNVHERIPDYFQDHSSHEEILASYKQAPSNKDLSNNCNHLKSDVFLPETDKNASICETHFAQSIDNQIFTKFASVRFSHQDHLWRRQGYALRRTDLTIV